MHPDQIPATVEGVAAFLTKVREGGGSWAPKDASGVARELCSDMHPDRAVAVLSALVSPDAPVGFQIGFARAVLDAAKGLQLEAAVLGPADPRSEAAAAWAGYVPVDHRDVAALK